jgi:hypothetical protein
VSDPAANGPTVHGTYDYFLGGGQHTRADRDLARAIGARFPMVPVHVRAAQDFHLRAARWCAERGVSRFIHCGHVTALPPGRNVHDAVREASPGARTIYFYRDDGARSLSAGLLAGEPGVTAARSGEGGLLGLDAAAAMLADGEPVCVIAGMLFHFVPAGRAAARIARLSAALPSGSVVVVSMAVPGESRPAAELLAMFTPAPVRRHRAGDLAGWLEAAGLRIVPPGVADVRVIPGESGWAAGEFPARAPGYIAGVLAVRR